VVSGIILAFINSLHLVAKKKNTSCVHLSAPCHCNDCYRIRYWMYWQYTL